jgi:hypothetical protein
MAATCKSFKISVISCEDLIPSDGPFGKTDPYVVVGLLRGKTRTDYGKTPTLQKTLNPVFPENIIIVPNDPSSKLFMDVYDEDVGKDDRTCGLKVEISKVLGDEPKTIVMDLNKKGLYKVRSQNPKIKFTIEPIIEAPPPQPEPTPEPAPAPAPAPEPKKPSDEGKLQIEGPNKYEYNLLVIDLDEKKFWNTEKSVPGFVEKGELQYSFKDIEGKKLIIVPYIQTTQPFKKGHKITVAFGNAKIETKQLYRGEFSLGVIKAENGQFTLLDEKLKVDRKNYKDEEWVAAFSEEAFPKAEYKEQ